MYYNMAVYPEAPVNKEKHGDSDTPITCTWTIWWLASDYLTKECTQWIKWCHDGFIYPVDTVGRMGSSQLWVHSFLKSFGCTSVCYDWSTQTIHIVVPKACTHSPIVSGWGIYLHVFLHLSLFLTNPLSRIVSGEDRQGFCNYIK